MKQLIAFLFMLSVAGCAPYKWSDPKAARCNELNRRIIFKSDRSSTRNTNVAEAQSLRMQEEYDKACSNAQ